MRGAAAVDGGVGGVRGVCLFGRFVGCVCSAFTEIHRKKQIKVRGWLITRCCLPFLSLSFLSYPHHHTCTYARQHYTVYISSYTSARSTGSWLFYLLSFPSPFSTACSHSITPPPLDHNSCSSSASVSSSRSIAACDD